MLEMKTWIYRSESNSWINFYVVLNKNWNNYRLEQSFTGLWPEDLCSLWGLVLTWMPFHLWLKNYSICSAPIIEHACGDTQTFIFILSYFAGLTWCRKVHYIQKCQMSSATYEQPNSDIPLKDSIPTMEDFYNDEFDIERAIKKTPSIEFIFIL